MFLTFSLFPSEIIRYLSKYLYGPDLHRLEQVEKYLHQVMSQRSFWMDPQMSVRQLKRQRVLATTPYYLQVYFFFYTPDHPDTTYDIESFDLHVIKAVLVASRILFRYHPRREIFSIASALKLPDGIILNANQVEPLVDNFMATTQDVPHLTTGVNFGRDPETSIRIKIGSIFSKDQPVCQWVEKYLQTLEEYIPEDL